MDGHFVICFELLIHFTFLPSHSGPIKRAHDASLSHNSLSHGHQNKAVTLARCATAASLPHWQQANNSFSPLWFSLLCTHLPSSPTQLQHASLPHQHNTSTPPFPADTTLHWCLPSTWLKKPINQIVQLID